MKEIKLSIVIPMYNTQAWIEKCIHSLEEQDIDRNDYEVLIIDDGSLDNSIVVVEKLQKLYDNIRLFRKENGGQSSARNFGIREACGKYMMFVDSDDYIEMNVLGVLLKELEQYHLDYIGYGIYDIIDNKARYGFENIHRPQEIISGLEYIKNYQIAISPCTHIIRTEVYRKNGLYFQEGIIHEDYDFMLRTYGFCQRMKFVDLHVYNYVVKKEGSTTSTKTLQQYFYSLNSWQHIIESLDVYFTERDTEYAWQARRWVNTYRYIALNSLLSYPISLRNKKVYFSRFRRAKVFKIGKNHCDIKRKLRCIVYRNTWLYFLIMCIYKRH